MPLKTITQLRRAGGEANPYGYTVVVVYRLTFVKPDGMATEDWPGADPVDCFKQFEFNTGLDDETVISAVYRYPNMYNKVANLGDITGNYMEDLDFWNNRAEVGNAGDFNPYMALVAMRTVGRVTPAAGAASTGEDIWDVECTYEHRTGGEFVNTRVTPFFQPTQRTVSYGEFKGFFNRNDVLEEGNHKLEKVDKWTKKEIVNVYFTTKEGELIDNHWFPICNSAGIPYLPQLKKTEYKQAYRYNWTSQVRLNFDDYVNKVNSNEYTLNGFTGNLTDVLGVTGAAVPHQTRHNPSDFTTSGAITSVFCKTFKPRTLLLQSVECKPKRWRGRTMYDYTLVFLYDEDEHDIFVLDEGKTAHAVAEETFDGNGELVKKQYWEESRASGEYGDSKPVQGRLEGVALRNPNGGPPRSTYLLDGIGQMLQHRPDNKYTPDRLFRAIWLRWKIYDEVEFGVTKVKAYGDDQPEPQPGDPPDDKNKTIDVLWGAYIPSGYSGIKPIPHTDTECGESDGGEGSGSGYG